MLSLITRQSNPMKARVRASPGDCLTACSVKPGTRVLNCAEAVPGDHGTHKPHLWSPTGACLLLLICSLPPSPYSLSFEYGLCNWFVMAKSKMGVY